MNNTIGFFLAMNATALDVANVKDQIDAFFGTGNAPAAIDPEQTIAQPQITQAQSESTIDEVDVTGMPWDVRIHASTKTKNEDGTWRTKRGLDKKVKAKVEADLRSTLNVSAPVAPAAIAPPAPASLPPVPGAAIKNEFTEFMEFLVSHTQPQGRLTDEWNRQVLEYHGVANGDVQNLAHNIPLIATVRAYIENALGL